MTFREFLKTRRKDQNAIGDIARDALIDPEWKGQRTVESLRRVFENSGAAENWRNALEKAITAYIAEDRK